MISVLVQGCRRLFNHWERYLDLVKSAMLSLDSDYFVLAHQRPFSARNPRSQFALANLERYLNQYRISSINFTTTKGMLWLARVWYAKVSFVPILDH